MAVRVVVTASAPTSVRLAAQVRAKEAARGPAWVARKPVRTTAQKHAPAVRQAVQITVQKTAQGQQVSKFGIDVN